MHFYVISAWLIANFYFTWEVSEFFFPVFLKHYFDSLEIFYGNSIIQNLLLFFFFVSGTRPGLLFLTTQHPHITHYVLLFIYLRSQYISSCSEPFKKSVSHLVFKKTALHKLNSIRVAGKDKLTHGQTILNLSHFLFWTWVIDFCCCFIWRFIFY